METGAIIVITLASVLVSLALLCLIISFVCFIKVFYSKKRKPLKEDEYEIPDGDIYEEFREPMIEWVKMTRSMKSEPLEIKSHDGLTLRGRYFEYKKGAPVELLFHGYRGNAERDLSGGVERCFALGRNAVLINQRASGDSDGKVISFGINECRDCIRWAEFASEYFGKETPIILTGVSMGAATVSMASAKELPENVKCVLADCAYSSPAAIIKKVIKDLKLPADLLYPFVRLGGIIFGGFDIDSDSPIKALSNAKIPVIFIHGDSDDFVPHEMSKALFEACASKKSFVTIEGAGHGLAFPVNKEKYISALRKFEDVWMSKTP